MKKITLIEKNKIIKTDSKTANVLNTSFSTIISNLNIPEYQVSDPISNDVRDPALKSIPKYKDHPSIKAIKKIAKPNSLFKACVRYFSLFLKDKCISSLFRTKYIEKKFNLQFFLPTVSRTFILSRAITRYPRP